MLRSVIAWSLGVPNTVFWGSLSLVGSLVDRSGRWAHACMVWWSRTSLRLMATEVEVAGIENVLTDRPQVFAANHQSLADIVVLAANLPVPFRFVAKRELFDIPFLGWHMSRAGFIAIDRDRPRQAARTLLLAAERIGSGTNALVFPEGTRSADGTLLPFRGGGFLLAIRAGVPIVPIAIHGTARINTKGSWRVRAARARLIACPAIDPAPFGNDREAFAGAVRAEIERGLALAGDPASNPPELAAEA
jgi:1-acyl-sn-glycerol-3-phosphate acyltransferase